MNIVKIGSVKFLLISVHAFLPVMSIFIPDMIGMHCKRSAYSSFQYFQLCVNRLSEGRNFLMDIN